MLKNRIYFFLFCIALLSNPLFASGEITGNGFDEFLFDDLFTQLLDEHKTITIDGKEVHLFKVEALVATAPLTQECIWRARLFWTIDPLTFQFQLHAREVEDIQNHEIFWYAYHYGTDENYIEVIQEGSFDQEEWFTYLGQEGEGPSEEMFDDESIFEIGSSNIVLVKRFPNLSGEVLEFSQKESFEAAHVSFVFTYRMLTEELPEELSDLSCCEAIVLCDRNLQEHDAEDGAEYRLPEEGLETSSSLVCYHNLDEDKTVCPTILERMSSLKESLSYTSYLEKELDEGLHEIFGKNFLRLNGYYVHDAESGSFGYGEEVNDKVRVTLINGILNIRDDLHNNLHLLSSTHGGTIIHFVFRPTKGWMPDLLDCCLVKCGHVSPQATLLAAKWRELIDEMGGIEGGGEIIHYAHSIGGTDTYAARDILDPAEQKMIRVITIGSPTMIPNGGFASVTNYVGKRDGVSLFDPTGYFKGYFQKDTNVVWVGTPWGIPLVEHTLNAQSYSNVIETLGCQFLDKYATFEN